LRQVVFIHPVDRNTVLELNDLHYSKKRSVVKHFKVRKATVKVGWVEGEEKLNVTCIKVVVKTKGVLRGLVYMMKSKGLKTEPWEHHRRKHTRTSPPTSVYRLAVKLARCLE